MTDRPAPRFDGARIARVSTYVALGTLASRLTGLLRVVFTAAALGDGTVADAYNLANVAPNIVYELLIGGVLSATLVPLFVRAQDRDDREGADAIASLAFGGIVAISGLAVAGAPILARLYGSNPGDGERYSLIVTFLQLILPEILFYGLTALLTAALHARRRFVAAAFAPVLNNVVVIGVMGVAAALFTDCTPDPGSSSCTSATTVGDGLGGQLLVGLGTTAGIAAMTFALIWAWRRTGAAFRWNWDRHHPMVKELGRLAGWTVGYVIANQIALFGVLRLANGAEEGTVTAYQLALIFFQLPHGLIAVTIMTTFLPELAEAAGHGDLAAYRRRFSTGLRVMMSPLLPSAATLAVLAAPLSTFALQRGAFGAEGAETVAGTITFLALGLPGYSAYLYACRGFYALEDTRTPFLVNVFENSVNLLVATVAVRAGAPGLGAAYSVAYLLAAAVILRSLGRRVRYGRAEGLRLATGVLRSAVVATAVGAVTWFTTVLVGRDHPFAATAAGATAALVTFVVVGFALRADGFAEVVAAIARRRGVTGAGRGDRT